MASYKLSNVEVATIIVALRLYQQTKPEDMPSGIADSVGDTEIIEDDADVDELCERLNCG